MVGDITYSWPPGRAGPTYSGRPGQPKVVGWSLADRMRTELVEDAITMAFVNRRPVRPRGSSCTPTRDASTSKDFAELARAAGVVLSASRKGECWDNAVAESSFATYKCELIDTRSGPRVPDCTGPPSTPSRVGSISVDFTAHSTTAARPNTKPSTTVPTIRRHDQHKHPVRRTGSSPSISWAKSEPSGWCSTPFSETELC
jgi:transposase InsO family protein